MMLRSCFLLTIVSYTCTSPYQVCFGRAAHSMQHNHATYPAALRRGIQIGYALHTQGTEPFHALLGFVCRLSATPGCSRL